MRLVFHIKIYSIVFLLIPFCGLSQERDSSMFTITSKYKAEYSPNFKFNTFNRGGDKQKLKSKLEALSRKVKSKWTFQDSFSFAKSNLLVGNITLGKYYLKNLDLNPKTNETENTHYLCSFYLNKEYKEGNNKLKKDYLRVLQYSKIYFLKQLFNCQDSLSKNNSWYKTNGDVFEFNIDSTMKEISRNDDRYTDQIIAPLKTATSLLEIIVAYVHEDDPILACAFNNIGEVLEQHVSLSQAYIAYSIGRNYNKKDKQILENIKIVKSKLISKNYKVPNFRKYFPKTEKGRFDYEILKEKIIFEQNDTIPKHKPILLRKKEKVNLPFPVDAIVPAGLVILFLLILVFVRSKRK